MLSGCTSSFNLLTTEAIDPSGGLRREDYIALRDRQPPEDSSQKSEAPPIPKMPEDEQRGASPEPISALSKSVSVNVTDSVPVRDVLLELVRKAGANLELDPRVQGNVIIAARNQPFGQVLRRICSLAKLRYTVEGTFIHIEPDEPYQKSYRLDYLALTRKASSDTSISTNVFDVDVGTNGGGTSATSRNSTAENNSASKVSGVSEADFWAETDKSIAQILGSSERKSAGKTNYSINKQAGIITVFGDQKQQDAVAAYVSELRKKASAQVLIDARIVEVELNDEYKSGIDWSGWFKNSMSLNNAVKLSSNFGTPTSFGANGAFTGSVTGGNFNGLIDLVQTFGTTRV
ncbi:MAG: secretin N-terminal domain-containing protein, partial [Alphaproteobacteria bacterium]|nr:secretin N-terminal domain-containing protein [Alphaproteobacteria bacterium]